MNMIKILVITIVTAAYSSFAMDKPFNEEDFKQLYYDGSRVEENNFPERFQLLDRLVQILKAADAGEVRDPIEALLEKFYFEMKKATLNISIKTAREKLVWLMLFENIVHNYRFIGQMEARHDLIKDELESQLT